MNIVRVPFRVSLFGGGTDFKFFYSKKNATVISFTIDKFCYLTIRKILPYYRAKYRLAWAKLEESETIDQLTHPSVKACLKYLKIKDPLEIHTVGDLPARSGLGSSSAFTAALLSALSIYKNIPLEASEIADQTIFVEQNILKEEVGVQDQIQVCHGGFNVTTIFPDSKYSILSLNNSSKIVKEIGDSLILVYSGISRNSSDIHKDQIAMLDAEKSLQSLNKINAIAEDFALKLTSHSADFSCFKSLLQESWEAKSSIFPKGPISDELSSIYNLGIKSGAACGKLLGAGGGGFFAFFVSPSKKKSFLRKMCKYICVPAEINFSGIERIL
mgnify:CR=1 FL=1